MYSRSLREGFSMVEIPFGLTANGPILPSYLQTVSSLLLPANERKHFAINSLSTIFNMNNNDLIKD